MKFIWMSGEILSKRRIKSTLAMIRGRGLKKLRERGMWLNFNMKNFLKLFKSPLLYLSIIAVGFFFIYSYPRMVLPLINLSPDENANYFFSKLAAEKGTLMSYERLNEGIAPIVHPRSINVNQENYLVPGSFLGIILIYGFFAKIFGSNAIIFLTPFFACLGALFFYGIIKRIFSWQAAFISSSLILPPRVF